MTRTAQLRDYVALQSKVSTDDPRFGEVITWANYANVWAQVLPVSGAQAGGEQNVSEGVQSFTNYDIVIRYRTDTSSKDRLIYRGKPLELISVVDADGLRKMLTIQARELPGVA